MNYLNKNFKKKTRFLLFLLLVFYSFLNTIKNINILNKFQSNEDREIDLFQKLINPHDFKLILNPAESVCGQNKGENLLLLAFIPISADKFKERQQIRKTWSNRTLFPSMRAVFLFGYENPEKSNNLANENKIYQDIIQEDFIDSYKNLTIKTIMGFKWIAEYCSNAKFSLKIDDDVVVNTPILLNYLEELINNKTENTKNSYIGLYYRKPPVVRSKLSKFYVASSEIFGEFYEPYHIGFAYIVTTDLCKSFYKVSLFTKLFPFEDVYIGLLAKKVRPKIVDLLGRYVVKSYIAFDIIQKVNKTNNNYFFVYDKDRKNFESIWNIFRNLSLS